MREGKVIFGNLLDAETDIIAHQVNCQGVMGSGVAKEIRSKYPEVFEAYKAVCNVKKDTDLLGTSFCVRPGTKIWVANLFGQLRYGPDRNIRYTSYDAIWGALLELKKFMSSNSLSSVAFPWGMSSVRGGASWLVIKTMIEVILEDYEIYYYKLQ